MRTAKPLIDKLLRYVEPGATRDDCWGWRRGRLNNGYVAIAVSGTHNVSGHRLSFQTFRGDIPEGMCVLHKCDNRSCLNPEHLFLGTIADNVRDMWSKGRAVAYGERHHRAKISAEDVRSIRKRVAAGKRGEMVRLAKEYGMAYAHIQRIVAGQCWKSVR